MTYQKRSCSNCLFFLHNPDTKQSELGICRRFPPKPFQESENGGFFTLYPPVSEDEWCGEWKSEQ